MTVPVRPDVEALAERCWCCGLPVLPRDPDPWEGRMDGYCEPCAQARCDTTDSTCPAKPIAREVQEALLRHVDSLLAVLQQEREENDRLRAAVQARRDPHRLFAEGCRVTVPDQAQTRQTCSCGRAEVELGCDLCAYCHREYDHLQDEREAEDNPPPDEDWYL